jgi:RND family efflux transporter MFP subunit
MLLRICAVSAIILLSACSSSEDRQQDEAIRVPARVSRNAAGQVVIQFDRATQARVGLKTEVLAHATFVPEVIAYGRLEEDPSRVFLLRAPVAGTLRQWSDRDWPAIGQVLTDGSQVALIDPRFTPVDRLTLRDRLASARADLTAASAAATAARAAYERAKTLNADNKNVSDRALQDTEARVKAEEARVEAARETANLIESSLKSAASAAAVPLAVDRGGEVVEVMAQPGESIEPGQPILRLARFDRLIARVDVPAGATVSTSVSTARIVAVGHEDHPIRAERISLGAAIDPQTQGQPFLFLVRNTGTALRPGLAVTAYLRLPGTPLGGVIIPRAAVVRAEGKAWAYVQTAEDQFVRRPVAAEQLTESGWFVASGFTAGERIVIAGAQVLLSEEFKSQIQVGKEGSGD